MPVPTEPAGNRVRIGWTEVEDIWVRAARSLPLRERTEAFKDIAAMTGRSWTAVHRHARLLVAQDRQAAREWLQTTLRKNWLSETAPVAPRRVFVETPTMTRPG